eukprot:455808_1
MAEALHEPHVQAEKQKQQEHIWPISLIANQAYASSFACIKCKGIPKVCITDKDGEILCNKCAENIDNTMINKAVQKMVNKLKTKCWTLSHESGCNWVGKIQDYDTHSKECEFVIVNCKECKIFKCQR